MVRKLDWLLVLLLLAAAPVLAQDGEPAEPPAEEEAPEAPRVAAEVVVLEGNLHERSVKDLAQSAPLWSEEELQRVADAYRTAIEAALGKRDDLADKLREAAEDAKPDVQKELDANKSRIRALADRLQVLVPVMRDKGMTVSEFQVLITEATGELRIENISAEAALSLLDRWFRKGRDWVVDNGLGILFKILLFIVILLAFRLLARILGGVTRRAVSTSRLKVSDLLRGFFVTVVSKTVFIIGVLVALSTVGIDIGPLLAGVGVLGFVIGFALQGTLSNFAAGIMILLYRPFDVGDVVTAGGVTGKVDAMTLVSTTILTFDNQVHVVPNNGIWGGVITNVTAKPTRRVDLTIGVSYGDDLDKTEQTIRGIVEAHPKVLKDPAPTIKVSNLGESSVDFIVRPWSKTADYWDVYWDLTKTLKQEFDKAGIAIPFPQRDVHLFRENAEA